jgi:hypothetical protein
MIIDENKILVSIDKEKDIDENGLCVVPFGVRTIGVEAFRLCDSVSIVIPNTVESIDCFAFSNCKNLKSVDIPNSVTEIGRNAFWYCENLESVKLGNNLKEMAREVFDGCYALREIKLPYGLEKIDSKPFRFTALEHVEIPETVKIIGDEAFYLCTNLKSIIIPEGVEVIGVRAFSECQGLESISMPDTIKSLGNGIFNRCLNLKTIRTNNPELFNDDVLGNTYYPIKFLPLENKQKSKDSSSRGDAYVHR